MGILKKMGDFIRRLSIRDHDGWRSPSMESTSGELVTHSSALAISAVWACVNLLAGTIATLPLQVYREKGGRKELAKDHSLYYILHDSPNYDQTSADFWESMQVSLELWGNAYAYIDRNNGKITALTPINPAIVSVRRLNTGEIEYSWSADGKTYRETEKTVFHIRGFGGNPLGGMSTLEFGRNAFGLSQAADRQAGSSFKNGLSAGAVITFPSPLPDASRDAIYDRLSKDFSGAKNAGKPLLLEGGATFSTISMKPEEAQLLESRAFSVEEMCRYFGVPPFMVGHTQKSTSWGSGIEQQTLGFQKFTLKRRLKRIEQAIEKHLLTPAERAQGYSVEFNIEGLLRADTAARSTFYAIMVQNGMMTRNEARAKENLPPLPGGDVLTIQSQNIPIGDNQNAIE